VGKSRPFRGDSDEDEPSAKREDRPGAEREDRPGAPPTWYIDAADSIARAQRESPAGRPLGVGPGMLTYVDENGKRHQLPENLRNLSVEERQAALAALSSAAGAPPPDAARIAALERLNELRAAGAVSEENYAREKRRLMDYGR